MFRRTLGLFATCLLLAATPAIASAATPVSVDLQDPSTGDAMKAMQIVPSPATVKSGRVTFKITNRSKTLVHELLLIKPAAGANLDYDAKQQRVVEDKLVKLVDTDDIQSGKSVTKTVTLKPGHYEMICNQPGHYQQGMHTAFDVHN